MYKVQRAGHRAGRQIVVVRDNQDRIVASASVPFVRWMSEKVPNHQLQPEQLALVDWCKRQSEPLGHIG